MPAAGLAVGGRGTHRLRAAAAVAMGDGLDRRPNFAYVGACKWLSRRHLVGANSDARRVRRRGDLHDRPLSERAPSGATGTKGGERRTLTR